MGALADSSLPRGITVVSRSRGDQRAAAAAIAAGHAEYPAFRHLFPDPVRRARVLRTFFEATVRDATTYGSVLAATDGHRVDATAVWLPPGAFPWTAARKVRVAPTLLRVLAIDPSHFPAFARHGAAVEADHRVPEPYWYLVVLSVRPEQQRLGLGSRLVTPVLQVADRDGAACRVETADQANVAYYRRFGFEVLDGGPVQARGGPPLVAMHRPPGAG